MYLSIALLAAGNTHPLDKILLHATTTYAIQKKAPAKGAFL
jgi:hypothetical protein